MPQPGTDCTGESLLPLLESSQCQQHPCGIPARQRQRHLLQETVLLASVNDCHQDKLELLQ